MMTARRATIVDVGEKAGVSTKTVSRVLNGAPHVSEGIRQRVREAADALDYHPNMLARALVNRRSHLIGLVYDNPSPSYVIELQKGVLHRLHGTDYRLVVLPVEMLAGNSAEITRMVRSAGLDGVVLAPPVSDNLAVLHDLAAAGVRCARVAPTVSLELAPGTFVDDALAAREIAEYLVALGHRDIGIITGDRSHGSVDARLGGYLAALAEANVAVSPARIKFGKFSRQSGYDCARELLEDETPPTAILAQNDDMAAGALTAALELGLKVPEELSVVGFDDSEVSRMCWPQLTTVRQPVFEMAASAAEMVLTQLDGGATPHRLEHRHILVERASASSMIDA